MENKSFVIIIGPPASGKMTVGYELSKLTELKLFHNHQSIDPILSVFSYESEQYSRLIYDIRTMVFQEVAKSNLSGLIFTLVWDFDYEENERWFKNWAAIFKEQGYKIYMAELLSDLEVRLERNKTEFRLQEKASKRNIELSNKILLSNEQEWNMKAPEGFDFHDGFLSINNTKLSPKQTAEKIKTYFDL